MKISKKVATFIAIFILIQVVHAIAFAFLSNPSTYNKYVPTPNEKGGGQIDIMFNKILSVPQEHVDAGHYYNKYSDSIFFGSSPDIACYRRTLLSSPFEFEYLMSRLHLRRNDPLMILDAGCGTGGLSRYILSRMPNVRIYALTNAPLQKEIIDRRLSSSPDKNRLQVVLGDFDDMPIEIQKVKFDHIFFVESIGYSVNREKLLTAVNHLLKPNGTLFIKTTNFKSYNPEKVKVQYESMKFWRYNTTTKEKLMNDIARAGFGKIEYKSVGFMSLAENLLDYARTFLLYILHLTRNFSTIKKCFDASRDMEQLIILAQKGS